MLSALRRYWYWIGVIGLAVVFTSLWIATGRSFWTLHKTISKLRLRGELERAKADRKERDAVLRHYDEALRSDEALVAKASNDVREMDGSARKALEAARARLAQIRAEART